MAESQQHLDSSQAVLASQAVPASFLQAVQAHIVSELIQIEDDRFPQKTGQKPGQKPGTYAAQLLWQRGIRNIQQLPGFLDPNQYQPASPFEFGDEMQWAVKRLIQAWQTAESIAIWGDFDADGITATAVLWEGLGQLFPPERLTYFIPNRLTESHGLSLAGLDRLAAQNCALIITCDTGSTSLEELEYAQTLGIDIIITDHHTLPAERPPAVAVINPRALPAEHPLAHLSGVAVAYKLVEALYRTLPDVPSRPLETLLDLVAIGLIADLVNLTGDCRYLAQRGIERLQSYQTLNLPPRPGIAKLLELCKRTGDRPTDISFGIGPRINAISRIHGDAHFCVELLTSQDTERCRKLAEDTELANARRKALQRDVVQQVKTQLAQQDLSTTQVIVLSDPQWSIGILGLVAGQIAQEYNRPTILLTTEPIPDTVSSNSPVPLLARGSARSVNAIDLYQLVEHQSHLLHHFGGHPMAMGLSLPVENIPLFTEAIDRQLREQHSQFAPGANRLQEADLTVTVAELGKALFRELKLLEPYGMGNPVPKLRVQNCWFQNAEHRNIKDWQGRKIRYIKTEFELWDETVQQGFPGVWWEHYRDELPTTGRWDAIVELDFNTYKKRYEVRLVSLQTAEFGADLKWQTPDWILDWRGKEAQTIQANTLMGNALTDNALMLNQCPRSWNDLQKWLRQIQPGQPLILAYPPPEMIAPIEVWQQLMGVAKYLSRTGKQVTQTQLQEKLNIGDRSLQYGFQALQHLGFQIIFSEAFTDTPIESRVENHLSIQWRTKEASLQTEMKRDLENHEMNAAITQFLQAVREEQFQQLYFYQAPLEAFYTFAISH
jgi:single-stranded-DNA-specific exonuclease